MRNAFLILALFLGNIGIAQRHIKLEVAATGNFPSVLGTGFGAHASAGGNITKWLTVGLSFDVLKFERPDFWNLPIGASIKVEPLKSVFFVLEPGYNYITSKDNSRRTLSDGPGQIRKGGFCMFGGVGYKVPLKSRVIPFMGLGISHFNYSKVLFIEGGYPPDPDFKPRPSYTGLSVRLGVMF